MAGIVTFRTLADALRSGYQVYDRTGSDYLVRTKTKTGWALAIVKCQVDKKTLAC